MKSRVELMREAVAEACACPFHPSNGEMIWDDKATVNERFRWSTGVISAAYETVDPRFYADVDYDAPPFTADLDGQDDNRLPGALVMSNGQGGQRVPLIWSERAVTFDRREIGLKSVVVPLAAADGWNRLVEVMELVITDFFDRHQPRGSGVSK